MSDTEVIRAAYAALNRNDIPAMLRAFDPQVAWILFPESPQGGTYDGLAAVEALVVQSRETWAEGACEPERFVVAGDKIVVLIHVHVRLKTSSEWIDARIADVFTFRDGAIVQVRTFIEPAKALEWAGVRSAEAS